MRLVWQVPYGTLLLDTLQNILLPLLLNIGLLALALFGYTTFRHFSSRSTESVPSTAVNNELRILRAINEEIVSLLPLGLLVHDQESNRTVISNKIADHLLPHLNLQNITTMAEQHQGIIQATSITSCMRSACSAAGCAAHTNFHYSRSGSRSAGKQETQAGAASV